MAAFDEGVESILNAFGELEFSSRKEGITEDEVRQIREHYNMLKEEGQKVEISSKDYYETCVLSGHIWGITIPTNISDLRKPREMKMANACKCRIAKYPFAIGGLRAAYYAKVKIEGSADWTDMVVKEFMLDQDRKEKAYESQSENSAVAYFLCEEYHKLGRSSKRIRTVRSRILKLRTGTGSWKYLNMEEKLSGDFKKWTNNFGTIPERNHDIVGFAKWTHKVSDGYLLLSDIQGVENDHEIFLTDPAVICEDDKRFGPTNFQPKVQMEACLKALIGEPLSRISALARTTVRRPGFSPLSDDPVRDALLMRRPKFAPKLKHSTPSASTSTETIYFFAPDNILDTFRKRNDIKCVAMGSSFAVFLHDDGSFSCSSGTPTHITNFLKSRSDPCEYASVSPSGLYYYFKYRDGSSYYLVPESCQEFIDGESDIEFVALGDEGSYFASSETGYQASGTTGAYKAISDANKPLGFVSIGGNDNYFIQYKDGSTAWTLPKYISDFLNDIIALGGGLKKLYFCHEFGETANFCLVFKGISPITKSIRNKLNTGCPVTQTMLVASSNINKVFMENSGFRCVALGGTFGVFIMKDGSLAWTSGTPLHLTNALKEHDGFCIYGAVNRAGSYYYFKYSDGSALYSVPDKCTTFMKSKTETRFVTFGADDNNYFALANDGSSKGSGCKALFSQIRENKSKKIQFVSIGANNNYFIAYQDRSYYWSLKESLSNSLNELIKKGCKIHKVFISGDVENYCCFYSEAPK